MFQGWEVLGQRKAVNSVLDVLSLRCREDKRRKRPSGQLEIEVCRKGKKSEDEKGRELGGILLEMTSEATEVDEIHPHRMRGCGAASKGKERGT